MEMPQVGRKVTLKAKQIAHYQRQLGARVYAILEKHYKGHPFTVEVDLVQMVTYIDHPMIPDGRRMMIFFKDEDPDGKIFVQKAGEILERLNIPRSAMEDLAVYEDAFLLDLDAAFKPKG